MAKLTDVLIGVGTTANDKKGDSLRAAFQKVNVGFTDLYTKLGLVDGSGLNLGAFTFTGSTISTTDSSAIVIDQATTITSNLSVGGDIVPQTAIGGNLGSSALPWRSLYVSNNTIYIGGTAVGVDANGALTTGGTVVGSTPAWANITGKPTFATVATTGAYTDLTGRPTIPTLVSQLSNDSGFLTSVSNIQSESNVSIQVNLTDSTTRIWQFGEDGDTVFPNNISINYSGNNVQFPRIIADSGKAFSVQGQGNTGSTALSWTVDPDAASQYAAVSVSRAGGDNLAKVVLQAQSNSGDGETVKLWKFDETGALTIPGDIRSEGNINIDINLSDSTLRRWQFGEDGNLETPGGVQVAGILKIDDGVHEKFQTKADATGIVTHDCSLGHIFYHTSPDALFTVNFTNLNLSSGYATALTLIIEQGGTGFIPNSVGIGGVIQTLNWQGNVTPTPSTNRTDVVTFNIINVSGTYIVLGQLTGF